MIKILSASADAYITDKFIASVRRTDANTGVAGTLDLFKIYGANKSGSVNLTELSRALLKFDLSPARKLVSDGVLNVTDPTFSAHVKLFDVYGGQTTPRNFTLTINPLSKSFDEGQGRDIARFDDVDVCNFLTASSTSIWVTSGANSLGAAGTTVDCLTALGATSLQSQQLFSTGEEDAWLDVTAAVSATLSNQISDHGFRLSYASSHENDDKTYFVKRFASRHAFDVSRQPQLVLAWDDSILDDTQLLELNTSCSLFLYNRPRGQLANITNVTGSNSIVLRLTAPISGGFYNSSFTGSQFPRGTGFATGIYSASVFISSTNPNVTLWLNQTGSVKLTPIWETTAGAALTTGSVLTFRKPELSSNATDVGQHYVTITDVPPEVSRTQTLRLRTNVFSHHSPRIQLVKTPVELPGLVVRDTHYTVRDVDSGRVRIPVDLVNNSTRVSSDARGMFFDLDVSNLCEGHTYVIDIVFYDGVTRREFKSASPAFRVNSLP